MNTEHLLELEVRDYELDLQGIVNNAVYQNYLEHGRHKYITAIGLDFNQLHQEGWDPVVVRAEIDYKQSLRSTNRFQVKTRAVAHGTLRFVFEQEIVRLPDGALIVQAKITAATLLNGRPTPCKAILEAICSNCKSQ